MVALASVDAGVSSLSRSLSVRLPVEKTVSGPEDMAAAGWKKRETEGEERSSIDGDDEVNENCARNKTFSLQKEKGKLSLSLFTHPRVLRVKLLQGCLLVDELALTLFFGPRPTRSPRVASRAAAAALLLVRREVRPSLHSPLSAVLAVAVAVRVVLASRVRCAAIGGLVARGVRGRLLVPVFLGFFGFFWGGERG